MPSRRTILIGSTAALAVAGAGAAFLASTGPERDGFEVSLTEEEWRARLTEEEFDVLRNGGTEPAFSSPLDALYEPGTYSCAGCDTPVYDGADKFDSETGWPSFTQAIAPDVVGTRPDPKVLGLATEVYCATCGGHLGHVFDDGPPPTGLRHCINGLALRFAPETA